MNETENSITILIKASNQRITDQNVQCRLNWTIKELKLHLSSVYPSKPHPDGQKLIYSGCLLPDGAVLSEILRTYAGHQNNTIHLVCAQSKEIIHSPQPKIMNPENLKQSSEFQNTLLEDHNSPLSSNIRNGDSQSGTPYIPITNSCPPTNYENYTNHQQAYQQMLWMQQAYMQYILQYFQWAHYGQNSLSGSIREREGNTQQENNAARQNPGIEDEEDDGNIHRGWVDWIHIFSRVALLFSVVYFYSSPVRCLMVTTMALLLYHLAVLRWRPVPHNNNNINNIDNNRVEEHEENINNIQEPQDVVEVRYPNWIDVCWTFLSSFFLSLIPEHREV